jgi:hypothetical protein
MLILDSGMLLALAALVSAIASMVWSIRRKP